MFFDFDDTLINTTPASSIAYDGVRSLLESDAAGIIPESQFGAVIEVYRKLLSLTPNDIYKSQTPETIRTELWEQALQECSPMVTVGNKDERRNSHFGDLAKKLYHRWYTTRLDKMDWLELETVPTLLTLRQNYKLVLITNGSSVVQWKKIQSVGAEKYFDHVLVSGDEPHDKPHESIFLKACKLCDTSPDKCIMIGDNVGTDILGANRANLRAAILFRAYDLDNKPSQEASPQTISDTRSNFTVSSITEIPSLIEKIFATQKKHL